MYRDMRLTSIGGGADEVMLGIISKYMGTLPVPAKKKKPAAATTTAVEQGTATAHNPWFYFLKKVWLNCYKYSKK